MDIFKLIGSIFIKNEDANKQIDTTAKKGKDLADGMSKNFAKIGKGFTDASKNLHLFLLL